MSAFVSPRPGLIPSNSTQSSICGLPVTIMPQRTALGDVDNTMAEAMHVDYEQDFYDIVVHGMPDCVAVWSQKEIRSLDATSVAAILTAHSDIGARPIRLVSCHEWRGAASFAQQLANRTDIMVLAATVKISVYAKRLYFKEPGSWVLFHPESWY